MGAALGFGTRSQLGAASTVFGVFFAEKLFGSVLGDAASYLPYSLLNSLLDLDGPLSVERSPPRPSPAWALVAAGVAVALARRATSRSPTGRPPRKIGSASLWREAGVTRTVVRHSPELPLEARMTTEAAPAPTDAQIKAKHRAMWASGDYPSMVETFLLPLGPRLVEAAGIAAGHRCSTSPPAPATPRSTPPSAAPASWRAT